MTPAKAGCTPCAREPCRRGDPTLPLRDISRTGSLEAGVNPARPRHCERPGLRDRSGPLRRRGRIPSRQATGRIGESRAEPGKASDAASSQETDSVRARCNAPRGRGAGYRPPGSGAFLRGVPACRHRSPFSRWPWEGRVFVDVDQGPECRSPNRRAAAARGVRVVAGSSAPGASRGWLRGGAESRVGASRRRSSSPTTPGASCASAAPARRVISLLPAGTETVVALGGLDLLVGRTRYDVDGAGRSPPLRGRRPRPEPGGARLPGVPTW
jgi:hypothetical protein